MAALVSLVPDGTPSNVTARVMMRPRTNFGAHVRAAYIYAVGYADTGNDQFKVASARKLGRLEATYGWEQFSALHILGLAGLPAIPRANGTGDIEDTIRGAARVAGNLGSQVAFRLANEIMDGELEPLDSGWYETASRALNGGLEVAITTVPRALAALKDTAIEAKGGFSEWSKNIFKVFIQSAGAYYAVVLIVVFLAVLFYFGSELKGALAGVTAPLKALGKSAE
jgi:hypothetical protein